VYLEDFQRAAVDTPRLYYANDMSHPTEAGLSVAAEPLARDILEELGSR
jgi:hypothetical protein